MLIEPGPGAVRAMLEDDMHRMLARISHDGARVLAIEARIERAPWTTCPSAVEMLQRTFAGCLLAEVSARRDKPSNCTHLHDLAVLAAAHAADGAQTVFEVFASDPIDGERVLEIRRNGEVEWRWIECDEILSAPAEISGKTLLTLRDWIAGLEGQAKESARLLQWASLVAHGRTLPMERQSDASALPPSCYTLQPDRAAIAKRIGSPVDFSSAARRPLEGMT